MNITNKLNIVLAVCGSILVLCLSGCSRKESGLYQINLDEATIEQETEYMEVSGTAEEREVNESQIQDDKASKVLYVHVCGAVKSPGVYEMQLGNRIWHAIEAAGGFGSDAAEEYLNLAAEISDGMKIYVPTLSEMETLSEKGMADDNLATQDTLGSQTVHESNEPIIDGKVNINVADSDTLCTVSGIGPTRASAIITYRETNGMFKSVEEIKNVNGIGEGTYSKIKDSITIGE